MAMKAGSGHCCIYSRRIAVLILLLVLPLFLSAAPYRVAVVSESASYRDIIMDALSILSGDITSGEAIEERRERDERKRTLERERELSELRQAESFDRIESFLDGADVQEDDDGLVLEISDAAFSQTEMEYLCRGDMDAFRYLLLRHDLDLIIAVSTEEDEKVLAEVESRFETHMHEIKGAITGKNIEVAVDENGIASGIIDVDSPEFGEATGAITINGLNADIATAL